MKKENVKILIPPLLLGIGLGAMFYLLVISDKQLSSFALKAGGHGGHGSGGSGSGGGHGGHGSSGGHSSGHSGHSSHSSHNASHSTHATHHAVHNVTHPAQHHHEMHTQHEHQHQHHHHDRPEKKMDDPKIKKLLPLKIKLRYCKPGVDPGCG